MTTDPGRGRIIGIGGIFFKSANHRSLRSWYQDKLGIVNGDEGGMFQWRRHNAPETEQITAWSIFPAASEYFPGDLMINYIVDDLDIFLEKCSTNGVRIDPKREDHEYGRFAWIYDPDGNKIELWQPAA
jgi:predicted enzyme related to lactoylglutathione lyase